MTFGVGPSTLSSTHPKHNYVTAKSGDQHALGLVSSSHGCTFLCTHADTQHIYSQGITHLSYTCVYTHLPIPSYSLTVTPPTNTHLLTIHLLASSHLHTFPSCPYIPVTLTAMHSTLSTHPATITNRTSNAHLQTANTLTPTHGHPYSHWHICTVYISNLS